jgi:hypothetical protein
MCDFHVRNIADVMFYKMYVNHAVLHHTSFHTINIPNKSHTLPARH